MSSNIDRIIEDYLRMVKEHLPNSNVDDIIDELRSHILDAAQVSTSGEISTDSVWKVLGSFGAPSEIAQQYLEHDEFSPQRAISPTSSDSVDPKLGRFDMLIMVIITFIVPFQISYHGENVFDNILIVRTSLDAILWGVGFPNPFGTSDFLLPILVGFIHGFFNIIFLIQFVRYYDGKISTKRLLLFGICTLILPMMYIRIPLDLYSSIGLYYYSGPLPTQLVAALLLLSYRGRPLFRPSKDEEPQWLQ